MFESANSSFYQHDTDIAGRKQIIDILRGAEEVLGARLIGERFPDVEA